MTPGSPVAGRENGKGELVVVGSGIQLGRHTSERTLSEIKHADVVFCLSDEFALKWLMDERPDVQSLHGHYGEGKDRRETYREMTERILTAVREGHRVCAVFYGHPGVFADVPHDAIRQARAEGIPARMEPGISAEACLYADLSIDPGKTGVQSFEATQFLVYEHRIDPAALLILWQVALCGDLSCTRFDTTPERLQLLVDKLARDHPRDTEIILYEAAQFPIERFRADRMPLHELPRARLKEYTTLVVLPSRELATDGVVREQL